MFAVGAPSSEFSPSSRYARRALIDPRKGARCLVVSPQSLFLVHSTRCMTHPTKVPITPSVLTWAIASSGISREDLAAIVGVEQDVLTGWERGEQQPALSAFRKLAQALKRPTATFFLPNPPSDAEPPVEFRPAPGESHRKLLPSELFAIREAARLQRAVTSLSRDIGELPAGLPRIRRGTSPETAGRAVRDLLGITIEAQFEWDNASEALREWRSALEKNGIIVLLLSMGEDSSRGFSIWDDVAPVIAANTHWNAAARVFTMFHELGHLVTRTSSICGEIGRRPTLSGSDDTERWCERFAAAALMPPLAVDMALAKIAMDLPTRTADLRTAERLSRKLHVSLRAATLRLIELDRAKQELYSRIPRLKDAKRSGGAPNPRSRTDARLAEYGVRATSTILSALKRDVIDIGTAMRYLDVPYEGLARLVATGR
jgi:Zn-dependent peptidase ImmA (M78 family)/DNA-binding XRE family transcriptional regulator